MPVAKEQIRQIIADNNISSVADVYTLLRDGFKDILQELMEAELDATLGYEKNQKGDMDSANKRNGHSPKKLKSQYGEFQIDVPRDRNGEFEPKIVPKHQRDVSGIEEKVISLYGRGMSTRDIHDQLQDIYGIELSAEMVSKITDKITLSPYWKETLCSVISGISSMLDFAVSGQAVSILNFSHSGLDAFTAIKDRTNVPAPLKKLPARFPTERTAPAGVAPAAATNKVTSRRIHCPIMLTVEIRL